MRLLNVKTTLRVFFLTILLSFISVTSQARTADNIKYSPGIDPALEVTTTQIRDALGLSPGNVISISTGTSDPVGFGIFNDEATFFPTQGSSYFVMSSGDVADALTANTSDSTSTDLNGLNNSQGNDMVQTILVLQPPVNARCLAFDFAYYSEEFPEWVESGFNDIFIAEIGPSTFSIVNDQVIAHNNFAFDTAGNAISINTVSNVSVSNAAGTTYDGGTPLLTARTLLENSGTPITVTLSIMDLGDSAYDSTVFIDKFRWLDGVNCADLATGVELNAVTSGNGVDLTLTTLAEPDTAELMILRGEKLSNGGTKITSVCNFNSGDSPYTCRDSMIGNTYRVLEKEYNGDLITYDEIVPK